MTRPILGIAQTKPATLHRLAAREAATTRIAASAAVRQRLRQRRSKAYVVATRLLDAGTHHQNHAALSGVVEAISAEFPDLEIDQFPLGLVGRCFLGQPYTVHVCDLAGNIIDHYEGNRAMPAPFERARTLALHPGYACIEVYPDSLRAIAADGTVSVIDI